MNFGDVIQDTHKSDRWIWVVLNLFRIYGPPRFARVISFWQKSGCGHISGLWLRVISPSGPDGIRASVSSSLFRLQFLKSVRNPGFTLAGVPFLPSLSITLCNPGKESSYISDPFYKLALNQQAGTELPSYVSWRANSAQAVRAIRFARATMTMFL